jgi:hypothetical protein
MLSCFSEFGIWVLIFSGIVGGEELIIGIVFLSIAGLFPLWCVLVLSKKYNINIEEKFIDNMNRIEKRIKNDI